MHWSEQGALRGVVQAGEIAFYKRSSTLGNPRKTVEFLASPGWLPLARVSSRVSACCALISPSGGHMTVFRTAGTASTGGDLRAERTGRRYNYARGHYSIGKEIVDLTSARPHIRKTSRTTAPACRLPLLQRRGRRHRLRPGLPPPGAPFRGLRPQVQAPLPVPRHVLRAPSYARPSPLRARAEPPPPRARRAAAPRARPSPACR